MKIITILGSPRRKGNTAAVLSRFEELARPFCQIERINIADYKLMGCLGCDACQKKAGEPGCLQKDDALAIFQLMLDADCIIYASPLYVWDVTAQLKTLWDRQYCLVKWNEAKKTESLMAGKRTALLVTCGGGVENNADVVQVIFRREMEYAQCQVAGMYIVPDCTVPKELGERLENTAQAMIKGILGVEAASSEH